MQLALRPSSLSSLGTASSSHPKAPIIRRRVCVHAIASGFSGGEEAHVHRWQQAAEPLEVQQQPQQHTQPQRSLRSQHLSPAPSRPEQTLHAVLELVRDGELDGLLEFVPDEVIDRVLDWRKLTGRTEALRLQDVLHANSADNMYLDTFALRHLVFSAPERLQPLSAMHVGSGKYLQRCAVLAPSGEECVLTFTLSLQDTLESQYRSAPVILQKWMLTSVTGEAVGDELPAHPSPSFPPEAIVEAQLTALRLRRIASVFAHASPENKAATGPLERFAAMLDSPMWSPLVDAVSAETLQRLQPSESTYMEVLRVTPKAGPTQLYMWIVSRQGGNSSWHSCWMTDAVQLVEHMPAAMAQQQRQQHERQQLQ